MCSFTCAARLSCRVTECHALTFSIGRANVAGTGPKTVSQDTVRFIKDQRKPARLMLHRSARSLTGFRLPPMDEIHNHLSDFTAEGCLLLLGLYTISKLSMVHVINRSLAKCPMKAPP